MRYDSDLMAYVAGDMIRLSKDNIVEMEARVDVAAYRPDWYRERDEDSTELFDAYFQDILIHTSILAKKTINAFTRDVVISCQTPKVHVEDDGAVRCVMFWNIAFQQAFDRVDDVIELASQVSSALDCIFRPVLAQFGIADRLVSTSYLRGAFELTDKSIKTLLEVEDELLQRRVREAKRAMDERVARGPWEGHCDEMLEKSAMAKILAEKFPESAAAVQCLGDWEAFKAQLIRLAEVGKAQ